MGREARCHVETSEASCECKVHLDTSSVVVRGSLSRTIPFSAIIRAESLGNRLVLETSEDTIYLDLGVAESAAWVKAILHPPTLLSKLGVKHEHRLLTQGFDDITFLGHHTSVSSASAGDTFDLIFRQVSDLAELSDLEKWLDFLTPSGAIWIVYPKATASIPEVGVINRGREAGLVDTKVCRFSDSHTALRFARKAS